MNETVAALHAAAAKADDGGHQYAGLVIAWRRHYDGWEAYVAVARDALVRVTWEHASRLHPVVDDGWQLPPRGGVTDHTRDDADGRKDNNNGIAGRMRLPTARAAAGAVHQVRRAINTISTPATVQADAGLVDSRRGSSHSRPSPHGGVPVAGPRGRRGNRPGLDGSRIGGDHEPLPAPPRNLG